MTKNIYTWLVSLLVVLTCTQHALADCNAYSPAFPLPKLDNRSRHIKAAQARIELALRKETQKPKYQKTSFSIAITSSKETLFEIHHTAKERDEIRPGAPTIDGNTRYRIASCTKLFTVLALLQQQKAGTLNLDDPVSKHMADLNTPQQGDIPWDEITLRTLASQLSGIPRDIAQSDILADVLFPVSHGLPPLPPSSHHESPCDSIKNYTQPCTAADLVRRVKSARAIFAPNQKSTYSNLNYELLSLVLANVTGLSYETLVETHILNPLNLPSTSFTTPPDSVAALPKDISYYWDVQTGIQAATGGLYSCTDDLTTFLRYTLTHYNALTPSLNWLNPSSPATGLTTQYGTPWEIFLTDKILPYTRRPVSFVTKSGGLPGYTSFVVVIPDYDIGYAVLVAGEGILARKARDLIGFEMVKAADQIAQENLRDRYTGLWVAREDHLDSRIRLSHDLKKGGLFVQEWISNGTDILAELGTLPFGGVNLAWGADQYLQVVPTLLFRDLEGQDGEVWRFLGHRGRGSGVRVDEVEAGVRDEFAEATGVFGDFCITDIEAESYGGVQINEVVFWGGNGNGTSAELELSGFRVRLRRVEEEEEDDDVGVARVVVQI